MNKENIPPAVCTPVPKRASTSTASSSSQPESPRVEQDPVRLTALKGLTECLLITLELKSADGKSQAESIEQADKGSGTCLEKGAEATRATLDEEQANRLAVAIEKELYGSTASLGFAACGRDYKAKYRSLFFNLKDKNNVSLRARLVSGELEPYDLVRLSHEELANPELQIINNEMRKRSIHNSVLTVEEEPYIKKTHKGELSFVPRLSSVGGPSTVPYLDHTRSDDGSSVSSGSGGDDEHPPNKNRTDDIQNANNTDDLTTDSPMEYEEPSAEKQRDKDAHDSIINSPTGSPTGDVLDKLLARIQTNKRSSEGTTGDALASDKRRRRTGAADYGIEDAERPETSYLPREPSPYSPSPPGSPTVHSTTPPDSPPPFLLEDIQKGAQMNSVDRGAHRKKPSVWEGSLSMHQVAKFSAKAVQIGGRELFASQDGGASRRQAWSDVLTKDISVDGRIGIAAVESYVSKQAESTTKEIVVLKFETQESSSLSSVRQRVEFDKLFEYFYAKQRNGVVPQRNRHVKDMYLVPMAAKDPLPRYLRELVDDASVRETVPTNCLLGVLVLNKEPSHSHSNHPHTRRAQPQPLLSQSKSTAPTSGRRRHISPGTSRPYPDVHGHHHDKRTAAPFGHSSPGHAQLSGETVPPLKAPNFSSEIPNTTSVAPPTVPQSGPKLSPGDLVQPSMPVYTPQPIPNPTAGGPKKIPTLQELQGLVNQLFPSARSASTLATGSPGVNSRPVSAPGPTAAAAAVSAQLSGANMSNLMASLPASLSMNHLRQPQHQPSLEQHPPLALSSQGNTYAIPPAPPVFPPGMPGPPPPIAPPNFRPLPPYLMAQYGLPRGPSMNSTPPAPLPPMPPAPPNPQQYFAHYFSGAQHLPPSAPPNSHPFVSASPTVNIRDQGPRDPR